MATRQCGAGVQIVMMKTSEIGEIMIEITSNCQAMCLDCGRNLDGVKLNPNLKFGTDGNMKFETFKSVFNRSVLPNIGKIQFDGNFGDSLIHPESMKFVKYIAQEFPGIEFEVNTNGGYHDTDYWYELGKITSTSFSNKDQVKFGIDGIDNETHDKYRRNVKFDKVIENAKAFIEGGGTPVWKFLEFEHNSDQIEQAKQLAKDLGFHKFSIKKTRWREKAIRKVQGTEKVLQGSSSKKHKAVSYASLPKTQTKLVKKIEKQLNKFKDFINDCEIECTWLANNSIQIEYDGRVWQCCHLSGKYGSGTGFAMKDYQYYVDKHGTDWNNINNKSLQEIFEHPYWNDLHDSFNNKTTDNNNPRIRRCAEKCGKGIDTVKSENTHLQKDSK